MPSKSEVRQGWGLVLALARTFGIAILIRGRSDTFDTVKIWGRRLRGGEDITNGY